MRSVILGAVTLWLLCALGCGSDTTAPDSSITPTTAGNVAPLVVSRGPNNDAVNRLYTTVTVCVPGTATCQTIDNVQVDTGSYGLRLVGSVLTLSLPAEKSAANGNPVAECAQAADGYGFGPVVSADVQLGSEFAASIAIQVLGAAGYGTVPADCSATGAAHDSVATLGANGILGIGPFAQDCGNMCAAAQGVMPIPATYYTCVQGTCTSSNLGVDQQVVNPVAKFTLDNNGVVIVLPSVPAAGASTVSGSLVFGVDTESNNVVPGTAHILPVLATSLAAAAGGESEGLHGFLNTTFNSTVYSHAFFDTGSSAILLTDAGLAQCSGADAGYYCPASAFSSSASVEGVDPTTGAAITSTANTVDFTIDSASTLFSGNSGFAAFSTLGGPNVDPEGFNWGLPFFYGRAVFVGIQGRNSSAGPGPFFAY